MKLLVRLLLSIVRATASPSLALDETATSRFRVLPTDLDINLHMNNGRFLQIMDLGRVEWLLRTGAAQQALRSGRRLMLSGVMTRYVRELRLFQPYTLKTRLIGWGRTSFYLEHRFEDLDGRLVAVGTARAMMLDARGFVRAADVAAEHWHYRSPPLPDYVAAWDRADRLMQADARRERRAGQAAVAATANVGPPDSEAATPLHPPLRSAS